MTVSRLNLPVPYDLPVLLKGLVSHLLGSKLYIGLPRVSPFVVTDYGDSILNYIQICRLQDYIVNKLFVVTKFQKCMDDKFKNFFRILKCSLTDLHINCS